MKIQYRLFRGAYNRIVPLPRRLLAWLLPPLAFVLRPNRGTQKGETPSGNSGGGTGPGPFLLIILLFLLVSGRAPAQEDPFADARALYDAARRAEQSEFWERAIELYSDGSERYPFDSRFPWALGNLYYSRRLYGLAWEEYRKVEDLFPGDTEALYRLSRTAGYLNRDALSAEYLERVLAIEPDNREAIGSLGWMYYKLHRLAEGEALLLSALNRFGADTDYAMTLGTIYSEMFRYDKAKAFYLEAIAGGEELGNREFTAVAHYNLSILESRFYNYAEAFDRTNLSLSSQNRASGRLSRGELYLRRLELSRTLAEYQAAYEIDTSPLSKLNLAQAYQMAGRLEEARLYAEDCLVSSDNSWMLNYGINPDRYKRDIHDILHKTYGGLAKTERRMIYENLSEWAGGFFRRCRYRIKAAAHHRLFRKYCLAAGAAFETDPAAAEEQRIDALIQYYNAFEVYPRRALPYLRRARDLEIVLIPRAEASYIAEEGILLKDTELIRQAIPRLDPLWERDTLARSYAEIALHAGGKNGRAEKRDAAERLYALNRGALRQEGLSLPVELFLDCSASPKAARTERIIRRTLKTMGMEIMPKGFSAPYRFKLRVTVSGGEAGQSAACELYDGGRGIGVFRRTIPLGTLSAADISVFAKTLGDGLFSVN
jgi:tetratricopeptide (TPR) repeat protein